LPAVLSGTPRHAPGGRRRRGAAVFDLVGLRGPVREGGLVGEGAAMDVIGLDLSATRARAVRGAAVEPLALDGDRRELPLAVSLEERYAQPGRAALALCRRQPHLACTDFLPHLGGKKTWTDGQHHTLDAARALHLIFAALGRSFGKAAVAAALPAYLTR